MKTTKTIAALIVAFLVAALFIGAGSASVVGANNVVYVYEYGVGLANTPYYLYQNGVAVDNVLTDSTGTFVGESITPGIYSDKNDGTGIYFTLKYPVTTLSGYLVNKATGATTSTSIAGKTLAKTESIRFITDAPVGLTYGLSFTTPAGGTTTVFGKFAGADLDFTLNGAGGFLVNDLPGLGVPLADVTSGEWSVKASLKTGTAVGGTQMSVITLPKYLSSDKLTFTVGSIASDAITVSTEKAIRGGSTLFTLTGTPNSYVQVTVSDAGLILRPGQSGVKYVAGVPPADPFAWTAPTTSGAYVLDFWVQLSATGTRTVELDSNSDSPDKAYTIKAEFSTSRDSTGALLPAGHTDKSVKFTLEKGAVTTTAAQESYYLGNDITISGTNTESDLVYIFIKGSNVVTSYLVTVDVKSDDTWTTTFNPKDVYETLYGASLDAGTYTFYAASNVPVPAVPTFDDDYAYASVSVALKQPFLSGAPESTTVAKGDKIKITGTAEATDNLRYYVFGTNKFVTDTISVADDATYTAEIETRGLAAGQYFVVIQHPMYDGNFNIGPADQLIGVPNTLVPAMPNFDVTTTMIVIDTTADVPSQFNYFVGTNVAPGVATGAGYLPGGAAVIGATQTVANINSILFDTNARQSANAAEALCQALDSQNIDDIYMKLTFIVATPTLTMNPVSDVTKGSALKVSGTTNLKEGTVVTVDVLSTAFTAVEKSSVNSASFITLTTKVVKGADGANTWEVTFDTSGLNVDTYTIQAATENLQTSTVIKVLEAKPTVTATATATATKTATATATATPTKTPGFGAFLALAGLGAVAVLVLRRD